MFRLKSAGKTRVKGTHTVAKPDRRRLKIEAIHDLRRTRSFVVVYSFKQHTLITRFAVGLFEHFVADCSSTRICQVSVCRGLLCPC